MWHRTDLYIDNVWVEPVPSNFSFLDFSEDGDNKALGRGGTYAYTKPRAGSFPKRFESSNLFRTRGCIPRSKVESHITLSPELYEMHRCECWRHSTLIYDIHAFLPALRQPGSLNRANHVTRQQQLCLWIWVARPLMRSSVTPTLYRNIIMATKSS
jgi:hypothetical protein